MATYTYFFADLLTDAIVAELPLSGVKYERKLNASGSWGARVPLGDDRLAGLDPVAATIPGRSAVYIDRDGVIVFGGIVWTRRYSIDDDGNGALDLAGLDLWSYFWRRLIRATYAFDGVDQADVVAALISTAQAATGGDLGVTVPAVATGILRQGTYYGYELKIVAEAVEQMAARIDGFDFRLDLAWPGPSKTLTIGYPRLGVEAFATDLLFDLPGNVLHYEWPEDATRQTTEALAVGAGEGDDMLLASTPRADLLADGWPLLEAQASYKDVRFLDTLQEHADAEAEASGLPVTIPALTVRGDVDPVVGSYDVGDDARIVIVDDRFPAGVDTYSRIIGFEVTPGDGDTLETVTLSLGEASS